MGVASRSSDPSGATMVLGALGLRVEPIAPHHADALRRFHRRLSLETTRRRFFIPHPTLSDDEVVRFTTVDHRAREALVALDAEDEIVGVARFDRSTTTAPVAEVAFVVADDQQHVGIGAALFALLADRARPLGVRRFVAQTLVENRAMLALFHHSGLPCRVRTELGVVDVELELDGQPPGAT